MKLNEIEQAERLYLDNRLSFNNVGLVLGYSGGYIRKVLLKEGVKPRGKREFMIGKHLTYEQKLKIARSNTGLKRSVKTRNKISQSHKGLLTGDKNPAWKGGRRFIGGYIWLYKPEHSRARKNLIQEHIWVWEQVHNCSLSQDWVIHHLNGIKTDNRPENLVALPNKQHKYILAEKAQRIRELETKVKLLERALESNQVLFNIEEN